MDALVAYLQILGRLTDAAHKPVAAAGGEPWISIMTRVVWFSKSFGLFYLIGAVRLVVLPMPTGHRTRSGSTGPRTSILDDEDKPWR